MSGYDEMMKMYAEYMQQNGGGNPPPSGFTPTTNNPGYDEMMKMYSSYANQQAASKAQVGSDPMANFTKPLPTGAVGTLPNGQPDYGEGFAGWWKGVQARMAETSFQKLPDGTYTEVNPSGLQLAARGIKEGVGGLLAGAGAVQEGVQGALSLTQTLEDVADKSNSYLPDINAGGDALDNSIYAMPGLSVVGGIYNTARILTGQRHLSWEEFKQTYDANAAVASGLSGTRIAQKLLAPFENTTAGQAIKNHPWGKGLYDANLRAEYLRRLQSGEKSDAILADLANPLAELGFDLVVDPFNLLTMGIGEVAKAKQFEKSQKAFSTIDELKDGWNVLKTAGVADNVAREAKLTEMAAVVLTKNTEAERILNSTRDIYSPFRMNNHGMQDIATHDLGNFFGGLISTTKTSPDAMGEALRASALLGSRDADKIKEGLQIYSRLNPTLGEYATSPEGLKASEFLYKMLVNEKTGKMTGTLVQDVMDAARVNAPVGEILEKWTKVEQAVLKEMYPSVLEMAAQPEKYKVPALALSIAKANEKAQMVVRPINGFFSTAYITMNPGNGGRNLLNNVFTTAIDLGMGAGLDAVTGFAQKLARKEASGIAKIEEILGFVSKSATDGLGHGTGGGAIEGGVNLIGFMKGLTDKGEKSTSIAIVYASVKRTMRKVLKEGVGIADASELRKLGIDATQVERLIGLAKKHNGDVAKAMEIWMGESTGEVIDTFRDIRSVMNAQDIHAAENTPELMEAINNVLDAPSKELAVQRINDIRINTRKLAEKAKDGLMPSVADGDPIGNDILEALTDGGLNVEAGDLFNVKLRVQRDVADGLNKTIDELFHEAMTGSSDPQVRLSAKKLWEEMNSARAAITKQQVGIIDALRADVLKLVKRDPRVMEAAALRHLDGFAAYRANPPRTMEGIKDMVWQFYFDTRKKTWDNILNEYMKSAETFLGDGPKGLGALTGKGSELLDGAAMRLVKSNIEDAMKVLQAEKITKDGIFVDGVKVLLNGGNKNAAVRKLALNELGIASASESSQYGKAAVTSDSRLINLLNKNLPDGEKITSLDDIAFDKAQEIITAAKAEKEVAAAQKAADAVTGAVDNIPQAKSNIATKINDEIQQLYTDPINKLRDEIKHLQAINAPDKKAIQEIEAKMLALHQKGMAERPLLEAKYYGLEKEYQEVLRLDKVDEELQSKVSAVWKKINAVDSAEEQAKIGEELTPLKSELEKIDAIGANERYKEALLKAKMADETAGAVPQVENVVGTGQFDPSKRISLPFTKKEQAAYAKELADPLSLKREAEGTSFTKFMQKRGITWKDLKEALGLRSERYGEEGIRALRKAQSMRILRKESNFRGAHRGLDELAKNMIEDGYLTEDMWDDTTKNVEEYVRDYLTRMMNGEDIRPFGENQSGMDKLPKFNMPEDTYQLLLKSSDPDAILAEADKLVEMRKNGTFNYDDMEIIKRTKPEVSYTIDQTDLLNESTKHEFTPTEAVAYYESKRIIQKIPKATNAELADYADRLNYIWSNIKIDDAQFSEINTSIIAINQEMMRRVAGFPDNLSYEELGNEIRKTLTKSRPANASSKGNDILGSVSKNAGNQAEAAGIAGQAGSKAAVKNLERIPVPVMGGMMPNGGQAVQANMAGQMALLDRLEAQVTQKWGRGKLVNGLTAEQIAAVSRWQAETTGRMAQARAVAARVAQQERDFALLNYSQKTTLDHALAYIMPYQFWYNRSYQNWMKRLAMNPDIVSKYAAYREWLDTQHADLPDWWKYNVSINDLPGVNVDNPMYFNLEASLNPLNGLTGIDFNDANKMVAQPGTFEYYWTNALNDIGKFGPSVWTPLSMTTAAYYYLNGQRDVASRWGGRLIPQTAPVKAIAAKLGVQAEIDPVVQLLSGKGLKSFDPYEARRIGRSLVTLVDQGKYTQEQAIEAARTQSGPVWDEANLLATKKRSDGTLTSSSSVSGSKCVRKTIWRLINSTKITTRSGRTKTS